MKNKNNDINEILKRPYYKACNQYGSNMGRRSQAVGKPEKLLLQRLRMIDHDYDTGGAYWGGTEGQPMWACFSDENTDNDPPVMVFVRAYDRKEAWKKSKEEIVESNPSDYRIERPMWRLKKGNEL